MMQIHFSSKLVSDNKLKELRAETKDKINFPFFLIKQAENATYQIKTDDTSNRVCIISDKEHFIIDAQDIVKEFLKNE